MSFGKALQNTVSKEVIAEYNLALFKYGQASKYYRNQIMPLKNSLAALDKLKFYEGKEAYSLVCKEFHKARAKFQMEVVYAKAAARGIELNPAAIAKWLDIDIGARFRDLEELVKDQVDREEQYKNITPEDVEIVNKATALREQRKAYQESVKEQFLSSASEEAKEISDEELAAEFGELDESIDAPTA